MAVMIKCKMCGGDLALTEGSTIATCEYCGTTQTVPSQDNEKKLIQFERADRLRRNCEFDKAAGVYESIVADFRHEAEAYWGLVLCKYGIEYVDDPGTSKKIPTCHRSSFESIMEDPNFEQVMENADVLARKVYREEAKQIEEIRKGIIEVSSKEDPYDIFICYKETDTEGQRTVDSVLAQDIYDALTDKGYRVFFSRITLEDKLGQEYEPYIFAALNSAKVMLAIGTDYEHYNAVWVKNEWSRYLKLMEKDKGKHLIPCFKGIDAYDMPKEFNKLQAQDLSKVGAQQDLLRGIEKLVNTKPVTPQQSSGVQGDDVNRIYIYNTALTAMDANKVKSLKLAIKNLRSLGDWNDAPLQLAKAEAKLRKRKLVRIGKWLLTLMLITTAIVGAAHLILNDIYKSTNLLVENYEYAAAIWSFEEELYGFRDSEKKIAELEEATKVQNTAYLELVQGTDFSDTYIVTYLMEGEDLSIKLRLENYIPTYIHTKKQLSEPRAVLDVPMYNASVSEAQKARLKAFFGANGILDSGHALFYDSETDEFVGFVTHAFGQDGKEYFRARLEEDGSLFCYNADGVSYTLIPQSYEKKTS